MSLRHLIFIFKRLVFTLIWLIIPLSAIPIPLDLHSLTENRFNLIATAGTMGALSLVFLFERIGLPTLSRMFTKILASSSTLYFVIASLVGLTYETGVCGIICIQILFWYTSFGAACLILISFLLFIFPSLEVTQ